MEISSYTYSQIDKGIRDIIKILNHKGYITSSCCEGHVIPNTRWTSFITFKRDYKFKYKIPCFNGKDAYTEKDNTTYRWYGKRNDNCKEKEKHRLSWLNRMKKWADKLPYIEESEDYIYVLIATDSRGFRRTLYSDKVKGDYDSIIKKKSKFFHDFEERKIKLG